MPLQNLLTPWGEKISDKPLQEYPRPQFRRKSYLNLNGFWQYAITKSGEEPALYDGKILVPFSPESMLSGVNRQLKPGEYLWYSCEFKLHTNFNRGIVLLHFGAVDSICDVYVNGRLACHHEGGYNAFSADITQFLGQTGQTRLVVRVQDFTDTRHHTHGKQSTHRQGIWYTPQSGIWQTVWLESVPEQYIKSVRITPDFDRARVTIQADCNFDEPITVKVLDGEKEIAQNDGKGVVTVAFPDGKFTPWTPENPHLYNLRIISR